MCGRYVLASRLEELVTEFNAQFDSGLVKHEYRPNYNVAPGQTIPVITVASGVRRLMRVRWGIVPKWSKNSSTLLINARGESVAEKVTFAKAFATHRILIPANGYYEWKRPEKDPYFISPRQIDSNVMTMAGLISDSEIDGHVVPTCASITLTAAPNLESIHDRMPACIELADWEAWLDPSFDAQTALDLLVARSDLHAFPVSRGVNSVRNNSPGLIEEQPLAD